MLAAHLNKLLWVKFPRISQVVKLPFDAEALEDADGTSDCVPGTRDCRGTVHVEQCCIICDATLHVCPALTCRLRDDTATVGATCDGCGRHICVDCKNDCVGGHDPSSDYVDEDLYGGCNHESLFAGLC